MSIAGLLSVPVRYALVCSSSGYSIAASVWAIFAAASSSSGKFLGVLDALYLSEPGFPWPAALTHLSSSAGSFMS